MPKYSCYFICIILLFTGKMFGQKKTLQTQFTDEKITVDGKFDEAVWKSAQIATDFVMVAPYNGVPIPPEKKTEVKVVYTNEAIYVAATLYDDQPNGIPGNIFVICFKIGRASCRERV